MDIDINHKIKMDPFYQIYCYSCHNYFCYCDCVHSFEDVFSDGCSSHESDGEGDGDDVDLPKEYLPDSGTNKRKREPYSDLPKIDEKLPGPVKPEPMEDNDAPIGRPEKPKPEDKPGVPMLVDKPKPDVNASGDGDEMIDLSELYGDYLPGETAESVQKNKDALEKEADRWRKNPSNFKVPKPGPQSPVVADDATISLSYFHNGAPYPYLTSMAINYVMDSLKCPVYTGPQDTLSLEWVDFMEDELRPWFDKLNNEEKSRYLSACFTSDPNDGQGNQTYPDYKVEFIENRVDHMDTRGKQPYTYVITPLINGKPDYNNTMIIDSDIRISPRAFNNKESIDKYFKAVPGPWGDVDYRPTYKVRPQDNRNIQDRSGTVYRFYQSSLADPVPYLPAIDDTVTPPPDIDPPVVVTPLINNVRNTRAFTGTGAKLNPFACKLGAINCTKWATFTNSSSNGAGDDGFAIGSVSDNQGDPLFNQTWYSGTTNHCAYIMLHEMVNRNGSSPTYGLCGFTFTSTLTQTLTFNVLTIYNRDGQVCTNGNSVFHEVLINGVQARALANTNDIVLNIVANTSYTVQALVRCDPNQTTYDKSSGGHPYIYFWPKSTLRHARITDIWQCVKINSLVAVGEPDNPPGTPSFTNGENVSWGSECPTSYAARGNGTLPSNQQMVLTDDILSKIIIFAKPGAARQCRINFRNATPAIVKGRPLLYMGAEVTVPFINGTESTNNQNFSSALIGTMISGFVTVRVFNAANTLQTDEVKEREYSYVVYNNEWAI